MTAILWTSLYFTELFINNFATYLQSETTLISTISEHRQQNG